MTNPLHRHTLTESAQLIAQGTISSTELIQSYLDQISRMNPTLNAFITVLREQALQDAKSADEAIKNNKPLQQKILEDKGFQEGGTNIHYLEKMLEANK